MATFAAVGVMEVKLTFGVDEWKYQRDGVIAILGSEQVTFRTYVNPNNTDMICEFTTNTLKAARIEQALHDRGYIL